MGFDKSFWLEKPRSMNAIDWLTFGGNPNAFPRWTEKLVRRLRWLQSLGGSAFIKQKTLAARFDVSTRWMKKILQRLEKIGLISKIRKKINHYKVNDSPCSSPSIRVLKTESTKGKKALSLYPYRLCLMFAEWCKRQGNIKDALSFAAWCFWRGQADYKIERWRRMMGELMVGG